MQNHIVPFLSCSSERRKMSSAKMIMILALLSTMKATIGQQPDYCVCTVAAAAHTYCHTRGCSLGTNSYCNDGSFDELPFFRFVMCELTHDGDTPRYGCNCPNTPSTSTYNGYYGIAGYDYTTCTDFGGTARGPTTNDAVDCCNFCCGRNDPYPPTMPPTPTTSTPASTTNTPESGLNIPILAGSIFGSLVFLCVCIICVIYCRRSCNSYTPSYTNYGSSYHTNYTPSHYSNNTSSDPTPDDEASRQREQEDKVRRQREGEREDEARRQRQRENEVHRQREREREREREDAARRRREDDARHQRQREDEVHRQREREREDAARRRREDDARRHMELTRQHLARQELINAAAKAHGYSYAYDRYGYG